MPGPKPTTDDRPWMELDATLSAPARPERPEREEPAGLVDGAASLDRRAFLAVAGLSASLAACERLPVRHALPYLVPPEEITPGVSAHYASTCLACPAACGLVATVRDGRPIKLEGHPEHPLSRGGLCAFGQGDLRALYDAGRLRQPTLERRAAAWDDVDAGVRAGLEQAKQSGRAVYVLSRTITSPTTRAAVGAFLAAWDGRLVEHDPEAEPVSAVLEAHEIVHGRALLPSLGIGAADLLVTLGTDLLGAGPDPVAQTAAWSARRRDRSRPPLRHVHVEGTLSLTGASADERWLATATERRAIALWLLRHVAARTDGPEASAVVEALGTPPSPGEHLVRVEALVGELDRARGRSLVVAATDDLGEALAVALLNRLLGNEGRTLDVERPSLVRRGLDRDLAAFRKALAAGEVGACLVLGLDPVDQLPDGEALAAALAALPLSVVVTDRPTATAAACRVVAAAHHPLECWGDAEPRPGVLTLAQPAIRPLFDTRPPVECLLRWAGASTRDERLFLRQRWEREVLSAPDAAGLEAAWTAAVGRGLAPAGAPASPLPPPSSPADAVAALRSALGSPAPAADGLEAELLAEVALRDGSRAHVPWLRELADPLTRVAWAPCARLAPESARSLGVRDGDLVAVHVGERHVELPVRVLPGQHPRVVGLPVGYGRADGGRRAQGRERLPARAPRRRRAPRPPRPRRARRAPGPVRAPSAGPAPPLRGGPPAGVPGGLARRGRPRGPRAGGAGPVARARAREAPVAHGRRPRLVHRLQRLRRGLPGREQRGGGGPARRWPATATCTGSGSTATSRATPRAPTCSSSR